MYIILDKPSLSFKKQTQQLPGKQITIYTNQLQIVTRTGLIKHIVSNNKLSAFSNSYSVASMNQLERQKFSYNIYLRTAEQKNNLVVDQLLENNQNLLNFKVDFPVIISVKVINYENIIHSQTKSLSLQNNFKILSKIGEGSFAQVYLARQEGTQYLRSIKVIDKERCNKLGELSYITNQMMLLKQISSPWIIQLYYAFQDVKNVYFVTQFCCYGDLYTEINRKFKQMTLTTKFMYWIQVALQICQLHKKGYIYRDLKPENVLIDYRGNAKLCDFGYSTKYKEDQLLYEMCGSYQYLPPELINKQGYNTSFDIYCLGLLLYELLTGRNPFKGITSKNLQETNNRKIQFDIEGIYPETKDLLKRLLQKDPTKRIGYKDSMQIFKHQFFLENRVLVVKILKNQRIQSKQTNEVVVKNLVQRKEDKVQYNKTTIRNLLFSGSYIYNYLTPEFNFAQKMGPKMVPSDNKGKNLE